MRSALNFARIFENIATFLDDRKWRFGVIGAFGLHAYGLTRATGDLDFLVEHAAQSELLVYLESLGYETLNVSYGYSNHVHALASMGRLDFVYVEEGTADILFSEAQSVLLFPGRKVLVPRPEHLVAMKVLAMKNDPSRVFQEMADIQFLCMLPGVDQAFIREQFERHGLLGRFHDLEKAIAAAKS